MTISGINSSTSSYTANAAAKADEQAASTPAKSVPSEPQPSTVVTLSDGSVSEVSTYSGKLSSMPMIVATAPEIFVQGDADNDNALSLEEFTEQLKRVGVSSDAAAKLFDEINTSKSSGLSIDEFVKGVVATNAKGDSVFQDLYSFYTSDESGKYSPEAFDSFMAQGATVARQYWAEHPELQQRS